MQVILKEKVEKLGEPFEIVNVKNGYALNYLIPKNLAIMATPKSIKNIEILKKQRIRRLEKASLEAKALAKKFEEISITIAVKAGEGDKMFGSVTAQNILLHLKKAGIKNIDKKMILLEEPIKALGIYNIPLKIHSDVTASVKVWVVKE